MSLKTLSVILPCYNEAKNIPLILEHFDQILERDDVELILVDNGSTDNSQQVLRELLPSYPFARSERVDINQGYGYGIQSGLKVAQGKYLGWTHSDMQTDPRDVLHGLALIEASSEPAKVFVKGLRKGRSVADEFFTIGMSIFESIFLKTLLWDINAQPNLFPRELFDDCHDAPNDFSFDLYFYFLAVKKGYEILRFDVKFPERLHGQSRWNINWQSKLRFISRTISFSLKLKPSLERYEKLKNIN